MGSVQGTWGVGPLKIKDFGWTELINTATGRDTSNPTFNNPAVYQATVGASQPTAQQKQNTTIFGGGPQPVLSGPKTNTSSDPTGGQVKGASSGDPLLDALTDKYKQPSGDFIDKSASAQTDAAAAAAEARRHSAMRSYQAKTQIAETSKQQAQGEYDWLVNELGSNKQDLLTKVATNTEAALGDYALQETKTKQQFDQSKQDILSTYRDLNRQQEKLMRGVGLQNSSRTMEAANRLNGLMGKDLASLTTNEADQIAMIGNEVMKVKKSATDSKNSIERETKSRLDKSALDFNAMINSINNNLMLSAFEKEDAYASAEADLSKQIADITTWAGGQKAAFEMQKTQLQANLDQFILSVTEGKTSWSQYQTQKNTEATGVQAGAKGTQLQSEAGVQQYQSGSRTQTQTTYKSKADLDNAYAQGKLTPLEYNAKLNQLVMAQPDPLLGAMSIPTANTQMTQSDPLYSALFRTA